VDPFEREYDEKREPAFRRLSFLLGDRSLVCYNRIHATSPLCRSPLSRIDDLRLVSNWARVGCLWWGKDNHTEAVRNAFCASRCIIDRATYPSRANHACGFGDSHPDS
jgi:hypothetical protein